MAVVGVIGAIQRWRVDGRLRILLLWSGSILLPLCLMPNKQFHYLFPLMPPLMILAGWAIDAACGGPIVAPRPSDHFAAIALTVTGSILALVGLVGVPAAAKAINGTIRPFDWTIGVVLAGLLVFGIAMLYRRGRLGSTLAVMIWLLAAFPLVLAIWYPRLDSRDVRTAAADIVRVSPNGPYCFYGSDMHLPMVFYLRRPVPLALNTQKLAIHLKRMPQILLLCSEDEKDSDPTPMIRPPAELEGVRIWSVGATHDGQHRYELFQTGPKSSGP
jgi:hypothetical protein